MFVIGSTELLVVGVLDLIAADLRVSIPAAGSLVTAYALGLAIGGPILTAATIRMDKRTVLVGALVLFVLGNVVAVLTASYGLFLVARTLTGAVQGLFIAAAFAAGVSVVPPARMGRAIAVVISGVAVSGAVGVPVGTLVGQALGWRGSFAAAAVLAVAALIATAALVPSVPSTGEGAASQARHALAPRVLAVLGLTVLLFASVYAALTYIVPFLQTVTGISGGMVSVFLLAYGGAAALGSFGGGRFADANAGRTLFVGSIGVAACLLMLYLVGTIPVLVAVALLGSGVFAMGMAPSMQYRVVSLAGPGGPFAQSLPASAANVGVALGSLAGGVAIGGFSASAAVITGLVIAATAVPVAWATSFLKPPAVDEAPERVLVAVGSQFQQS
jgi:DHA1 family inner membrane transport protein